MLIGLLIFAGAGLFSIQVAKHLAQVIEALRIGGAIVCCVAGTVILALTLRHVSESAKASAAVRAAATAQHDDSVPLGPARDPLTDAGLAATSDPAAEPALAAAPAAPGVTDAEEIAAVADHLASDRVHLLGMPGGSVLERVRS
jgi:hypothetical protein